jgi:hypothetical protein
MCCLHGRYNEFKFETVSKVEQLELLAVWSSLQLLAVMPARNLLTV